MTTWFSAADCRLDDFRALVEQQTDRADYPHAADVQRNVLIYEPAVLAGDRREVQPERCWTALASSSSGAPSIQPWSTGPPPSSPR
jgi:hypothetical protein